MSNSVKCGWHNFLTMQSLRTSIYMYIDREKERKHVYVDLPNERTLSRADTYGKLELLSTRSEESKKESCREWLKSEFYLEAYSAQTPTLNNIPST